MKRIVVPVWGSRISPVFDTARQFLVIDFDKGRIVDRSSRFVSDTGAEPSWFFIHEVISWKPGLVVCGAISQPLIHLFESSGIELYPWLSGEVEQVLLSFLSEQGSPADFLMPGCSMYAGLGRACRQQRLRGRASGRGKGKRLSPRRR